MKTKLTMLLLLIIPIALAQQTGIMDITNYQIEEQGDFQWIEIEGAELAYGMFELKEPYIAKQLTFPVDKIIEDIELISYSDPVDFEINLPEVDYDDEDNMIYVERECVYDSRAPYLSKFPPSYTDEEIMYAVRFYPLEVVDCEKGKFRLYQKMMFQVSYKGESRASIKELRYDRPIIPGSTMNVEVVFEGTPSGTLKLIEQGGSVVEEKEAIEGAFFEIAADSSVIVYKVMYYEGDGLASYKEIVEEVNWATLDVRVLSAKDNDTKELAIFVDNLLEENSESEMLVQLIYLKNLTASTRINETITASPGEQIFYRDFEISGKEDLEDVRVILIKDGEWVERTVPGFIKLRKEAIEGTKAPPTPGEILEIERNKTLNMEMEKEKRMSSASKIAIVITLIVVVAIIAGAYILLRRD